MIYRILITIAVIAILAFAAVKGGSESSPDVAAPASSSSPDEAKFKGLTIPN